MHPTNDQLERYARRTLPPTDLLAVDDHLATCDTCRSQTAALAGMAGALADLRSRLLPIESHLSDAQVVEYAAGELSHAAKASVEAHVEACPTCARDIAEVRAYAHRRPGRRAASYAAAAAALIAVATASLLLSRSSPGPEPSPASLAGLETVPAGQQQRVRAALDAGVAEPPPELAGLGGGPEALMGASPAASFRLIEPLATVTVSDRPRFRWEPVAGADAYLVSLSDEEVRQVVRSPAVRRTEWTPDEPLPRGRIYTWQVTAQRGAESISAPAPPAPPARFQVLDETNARQLESAARNHPRSHLLLGILYAQAGVRDEAATHLQEVRPEDPYFEVARRTLERLRGGGRPE